MSEKTPLEKQAAKRVVEAAMIEVRKQAFRDCAEEIRKRLTYTTNQEPRFTWHDVEDLIAELRGKS